jgi:hypothetical protein
VFIHRLSQSTLRIQYQAPSQDNALKLINQRAGETLQGVQDTSQLPTNLKIAAIFKK